jgi:hypothetical protein
VGLLKINVERAEWDVLAGIQEQDWHKVSRSSLVLHALFESTHNTYVLYCSVLAGIQALIAQGAGLAQGERQQLGASCMV